MGRLAGAEAVEVEGRVALGVGEVGPGVLGGVEGREVLADAALGLEGGAVDGGAAEEDLQAVVVGGQDGGLAEGAGQGLLAGDENDGRLVIEVGERGQRRHRNARQVAVVCGAVDGNRDGAAAWVGQRQGRRGRGERAEDCGSHGGCFLRCGESLGPKLLVSEGMAGQSESLYPSQTNPSMSDSRRGQSIPLHQNARKVQVPEAKQWSRRSWMTILRKTVVHV